MSTFTLVRSRACLTLGLLLAGISSADAEERTANHIQGRVLVRFAPDALVELHQQPLAHHCEVKDNVLGTAVQGECHTDGTYTLKPSETENVLLLTVAGKCVTKSTGRNGPATIKTTATTDYTATSKIVLNHEQGKFVASPVEVAATTNVRTDDLKISTGGIAGRVARTVAERRIADSRAESTAIAKDRAVNRVRNVVTAELAEKLNRINQSHERMQTVLGLVAPELTTCSRLAANKEQLLFCFAAKETTEQVVESWPKLTHGCEVWIHQSAVSDELKGKLAVAQAKHSQQVPSLVLAKVDQQVVAVAEYAETEEPAEKLLSQHGEWIIVRVPTVAAKVATTVR